MSEKCKLSVIVLVYNQERTIAQTLDSILLQEHEYKYEIVIGDDASKDRSKEILQQYKEKYPDVIQLIYNEHNRGVVGNWVNTLQHCRGEYIMECAPDDWWLPGKIERQIAFLDTHPEYGMCYGRVKRFSETRKKYLSTLWGKRCDSFDDIIKYLGKIPPMSMCFRRELANQYISEIRPEEKDWLMEDYPFYIWLIVNSRVYYDPSILGVYRIVENSISHPSDFKKKEKFCASVIEVKRFWLNYLGKDYDEEIIRDEYNRYMAKSILKVNRCMAGSYFIKIVHPNKKDIIFRIICRYQLLYFLYLKRENLM